MSDCVEFHDRKQIQQWRFSIIILQISYDFIDVKITMLHKFEIANTPKKFPENISANMFQTVIRQSTFLSSQHSHRIFHSFPAPRIAKVFKYIDYNGSGTITLDEIDEKAYQAYLRGRAFWTSRLFYITKRSEHRNSVFWMHKETDLVDLWNMRCAAPLNAFVDTDGTGTFKVAPLTHVSRLAERNAALQKTLERSGLAGSIKTFQNRVNLNLPFINILIVAVKLSLFVVGGE